MPDSSGLLYAKGDGTIGIYDFALSHVTQMHERHEDEVNSARFIDDSAQVVASGSDDSTIRIWDRRDWTKREAGALVGHLEGITSVASRGDGKYIVSNSKDQTAKLWDLRKMISNLRDIRQKTAILCTHFYYQDRDYIPSKVKRHPYDLSVMTYRGHEVLQTAIRANFSPLQSTGGQYIYSGSADGEIYIWKLDGTLVRQLRGSKVLRRAKYLNDKFYPNYQVHSSGPIRLNRAVSNCIRECSWHPHAPVIYAPAICKDHRHDSFYGGKGAIFSFSHDHDYSEIGSTPKGDFDYVNTRESSSLRYLNALYNKRHVA
jgi:WD repeat-containing protein 23